MDPFNIPFSGTSSWVELLLSVAGGIVMLIYLYQVFWAKINEIFFPKPDYEERAAKRLKNHRQPKATEGASEA